MAYEFFDVPINYNSKFWCWDAFKFKRQIIVMCIYVLALFRPVRSKDLEIPMTDDCVDRRSAVCEIVYPNGNDRIGTGDPDRLAAEQRTVEPVVCLGDSDEIERAVAERSLFCPAHGVFDVLHFDCVAQLTLTDVDCADSSNMRSKGARNLTISGRAVERRIPSLNKAQNEVE